MGFARFGIYAPLASNHFPALDRQGIGADEFTHQAQLVAQLIQLANIFMSQQSLLIHMLLIILVIGMIFLLRHLNGGGLPHWAGVHQHFGRRIVWTGGVGGLSHLAWFFFVGAACCIIGSGEVRPHSHCVWIPVQRFGEARHPGPSTTLRIGTYNPGGARGREQLLTSFGPGIWNINETHLSSVAMPAFVKQIRYHNRQSPQDWRVYAGHPVPLRSNSQTVGCWSGVAQISTNPGRPIPHSWPHGEYVQGRIQLTQFAVPETGGITGANLYGWPSSATWPKSRQWTNRLLQQLSETLIKGHQGPRFVAGDFNGTEEEFPELAVWRQNGWQEIQDIAQRVYQQKVQPTYGNTSRIDMIFVSPELAQHLQHVGLQQSGAGHAALYADFRIPCKHAHELHWPLPARIPWDHLDTGTWKHHAPDSGESHHATIADEYASFGRRYEQSIGPFLDSTMTSLPTGCKGRAQRQHPELRAVQFPLAKPSRKGEAQLTNEFTCREIVRWFTQLRRLQSLEHNLRQDQPSDNSLLYRVEVWGAIRRAKGFQKDFVMWWPARPVKLQISPTEIALVLPSHQAVVHILQDFTANFRQYEAWHNRQRHRLLQASLAEDKRRLFKQLQDKTRPGIDTLQSIATATIVDVSSDGCLAHVDRPISDRGLTTWTIDGTPAQVKFRDTQLLEIDTDLLLVPGQIVEGRKLLSEVSDIHDELLQYWTARWRQHADTPPEAWERIVGFIRAYIAPAAIQLPSIDLSAWEHAVSKFNSRSARGPDGFDSKDLQHMPYGYQQQLVDLLNKIENTSEWPTQLSAGMVHGLAKQDDSCAVADYRPVIIHSMVYRAWSSLRAGQILGQLAPVLHNSIIGFMPKKEAGEVWQLTQAAIEHAIYTKSPLQGFVTDIRRAFNNLPRSPVMALARQLGFPETLVKTWGNFLQQADRYFVVRKVVSRPLQSTCGLPEGCALSCIGMLLINHCHAAYMRQYAPQVLSMSFVDNYELLARQVAHLAHGILVQSTFLELIQLETDPGKTYTWATGSHDRLLLKRLHHRVAHQERDLGGSMTYQAKPSPQAMDRMLDKLQPLWTTLRRIACSAAQKELLVKQAIWPKAFHASGILHVTETQLSKLRTQVTRALGHGKAGASPIIRLSLGHQPLLDPGLYRLWSVFRDFRRLASKQPMLVQFWNQFHEDFDGTLHAGPCSILLQQFQQLGWYVIQPPYCLDHDGLQFDFIDESTSTIWRRTLDAWYQHVAARMQARSSYEDLQGVNVPASQHQEGRLLPLQRAQITALREGAFVTARHYKHYDVQQDGSCHICGQQDSLEHRCLHCPGFQRVRQQHGEAVQRWRSLPTCLTHHLLAPRNPWAGEVRRAFCAVAAPETYIETLPECHDTVDLFSDGSCTSPTYPSLSLAGWSVVSATHGAQLAAGPLGGWEQCIARAELTAAVQALAWSMPRTHRTVLWTDSSYVATHFWRLTASSQSELPPTHRDLWLEVRDHLAVCAGRFQVVHISAHQQMSEERAEVDNWVAYWNAQADAAAAIGRQRHTAGFWQLWASYKAHEEQTLQDVDVIRRLQLGIAEANQILRQVDWMEADNTEDEMPDVALRISQQEPWIGQLPDDWAVQLDTTLALKLWCTPFLCKFLAWQQRHLRDGVDCLEVSWLELVFLLHANQVAELPHPIADHNGTRWVLSSEAPQVSHVSSTVAGHISFLKGALQTCLAHFLVPISVVKGISLGACGVSFPLTGTALLVTASELRNAHEALRHFTSRRLVKVVNDLSRPICR